ncbi:uncharacterized protein LOC127283573 [Leptopilina boulardi]|uniref:uncharacterized protein LOC127283573 n=1 Tax=Leptopilina boulardi TaxID=63433 RepID=UPI0021F5ADFA|nr:uncharacterized protein LOC127283573 [Leptopilina boulardi]
MNSTTIIAEHSSNFQLLPVCIFFGITFYKHDLITLGEKHLNHHPLITFFENINNFNNEFEMKLQFLQKMLKESQPSQVDTDDIPDMKYVDEKYQYIIMSSMYSFERQIFQLNIKIFNRENNKIFKILQQNSQRFPTKINNEDNCFFHLKENLNFLVTKRIFKEYISPIFQGKNLPLANAFNNIEISQRDLINADITGNSQMARNIPYSLDDDLYNSCVMSLQQFCQKGMSGIRKDKDILQRVRKSVETINNYEVRKLETQENENKKQIMYFSETISRLHFVDVLKNLEGKEFYFNDITQLTDIKPNYENNSKQKPKIYLKNTEIRYHIKFNSQHGLVDLAAFHDSFKNQYIVFPEVVFLVIVTKKLNGILEMELEEKPTTIDEWKKIRKLKYFTLTNKEENQLKRMESIENAAYLISLNTPLHRLDEMEKFFKKYILNIDDDTSSVPTYDKLSKEIQSGDNYIPPIYAKYKIKNSILVDDVLFQNTLNRINYLNNALEIIKNYYNNVDIKKVEHVFKKYWNTPEIKELITFLDYYIIYLDIYENADSRLGLFSDIALYRVALRYCNMEFINNPITLYRVEYTPMEEFKRLLNVEKDEKLYYEINYLFYYTEEQALENCLNCNNSFDGKLLIHKVIIKNQAGLVDLSHILKKDYQMQYLFSEVIELKKDRMEATKIKGEDVIKLIEYDDNPKEERMVRLVKMLYPEHL